MSLGGGHKTSIWNKKGKAEEMEWNSLTVVQDLQLTKKVLIDDYRRWKNKHMVKEFYFKAKIKDIKRRLSQYQEIWMKNQQQPRNDRKAFIPQPSSLQEALFSSKKRHHPASGLSPSPSHSLWRPHQKH